MTDPARSAGSLAAALAGLAEPAPDTLVDAVFDRWVRVPSAVGPVLVAFGGRGVRFLRAAARPDGAPASSSTFGDVYGDRFGRPLRPGTLPPPGLAGALDPEGPAGEPPRLDLRGLSAFERDVLAATAAIPPGQTRPYAWVAREAGNPRAVRAAGSVLARNPVPLLVPCHRVVRSDGGTGHYIFGAEAKRALLAREREREGGR